MQLSCAGPHGRSRSVPMPAGFPETRRATNRPRVGLRLGQWGTSKEPTPLGGGFSGLRATRDDGSPLPGPAANHRRGTSSAGTRCGARNDANVYEPRDADLVGSASSARHGCTASASRDIMTASVAAARAALERRRQVIEGRLISRCARV